MFSDLIVDNFTSPTHAGEIDAPVLVLENKDPVCGDQIRIGLAVENGQITSARFRAWGCATSMATANILCKWLEGRGVQDCAEASAEEISALLGQLSPEQRHCQHIAQNLVRQLAAQEAWP
ncbi:iron-sulfur cluster assembly scaffold protein [Actibacterium sp. XHP0104]|uniref:iron-sulfur cluster assembly scaffold protein n=1 Tax=Actibacterium sp. XHP0104 TaxID=2984335 RepID=UPI0021E8552C|nr:iron-sulfur cluster assembly scaffold protein [Actibacterium sp. XHP0104]MCV2881301.1 iron-sulfur cluster assembly scaffold protein [Actibacterium sp. XHP0104]